MNNRFKSLNFAIVLTVVTFSTIFSGCQEDTATLVKDSSSPIPAAKIGLDGKYDSSGLAKRVARALAEDSVLNTVSTVYVAQNGNKIIFKGTIQNADLRDRLLTVAQNVSGVSDVDLSQVEIR